MRRLALLTVISFLLAGCDRGCPEEEHLVKECLE
jgi:hypothetical protein